MDNLTNEVYEFDGPQVKGHRDMMIQKGANFTWYFPIGFSVKVMGHSTPRKSTIDHLCLGPGL